MIALLLRFWWLVPTVAPLVGGVPTGELSLIRVVAHARFRHTNGRMRRSQGRPGGSGLDSRAQGPWAFQEFHEITFYQITTHAQPCRIGRKTATPFVPPCVLMPPFSPICPGWHWATGISKLVHKETKFEKWEKKAKLEKRK